MNCSSIHASSFKVRSKVCCEIVPNVYSTICVAGKWRCFRPERVQQGPCLRPRDQEQQQEEEEEAEAACQSRPTAGMIRVTNMSDFSEHTSFAVKLALKVGLEEIMKYQFNTGHLLPAGGSDSRERGCRDPKASNDKSGSLHLGTIQYA